MYLSFCNFVNSDGIITCEEDIVFDCVMITLIDGQSSVWNWMASLQNVASYQYFLPCPVWEVGKPLINYSSGKFVLERSFSWRLITQYFGVQVENKSWTALVFGVGWKLGMIMQPNWNLYVISLGILFECLIWWSMGCSLDLLSGFRFGSYATRNWQ